MNAAKKTVIVTGASSGLGFAIAKAYLERGYNVVGNARTIERLQEAAQKLGNPDNFVAVAGDIALPSTAKVLFSRAVEAFGKVDILINNAGIFLAKPITKYTEEDVNALVGTNLMGFFYPAQAAAEHMAANGEGHIVNITASIALQSNAKVPASLPVLVKGGLNQVTRALALELAKSNVKVNAVAPGIIQTPLHKTDEGTRNFLKTLAPSGKTGVEQDIVDAVLYLTDSNFTTGAVLPVDGGMSSGIF